MHTIKFVKGALVLVNHVDKDQDQAFMVGAALGRQNKVRCHEIRQLWRDGTWASSIEAMKDLGKKRYRFREVKRYRFYADKLELVGARGKVTKTYTFDRLSNRTTPESRLRAEMRSSIEGYVKMTRYGSVDYYAKKLSFGITVGGQEFSFDSAKTHMSSPRAAIKLPWSWRRDIGKKGLGVIDGHFVVQVLGETDAGGIQVLAVRLIRHGMENDTQALKEKPKDLQGPTRVTPVIAQAIAYQKPRTDKRVLVWAPWVKPIRAKEAY